MRIHKTPAVKDYRGYLFKSFEDGVHGIQECLDRGFAPSMVRLQDSGESELAFNMKAPGHGVRGWIQNRVKSWLKSRGYTEPCILIVGFEGEGNSIGHTRRSALRILKRHGGFSLGTSVGNTWSNDKFNIPYLRDYIMDYGCMADVAETSTVWSQVLPLYAGTVEAVKARFRQEDGTGYIGCHISHTYKTGACLYFTFARRWNRASPLDQSGIISRGDPSPSSAQDFVRPETRIEPRQAPAGPLIPRSAPQHFAALSCARQHPRQHE
jgi:alkyldihydroxyacetonephosphate synthase